MKLLIAYDGSECAREALAELHTAGLPCETEALVLTVAEPWSPPASTFAGVATESLPLASERAATALEEAQNAAAVIAGNFPSWRVTSLVETGAPATRIIQIAADWGANLVVAGSQGLGALKRMAFGSVSLKVLHEAPCSVRIARWRERTSQSPALRLLLGLDGSADAQAAVTTVAQRNWPAGTEARLATAIGAPDWQTGLPFETVRTQARALQQEAENQLAEAGLVVSSVIAQLYAADFLLEEAKRWKANCIFAGTRRRGLPHRSLIGSVSSTVTAKAACSVEIVRGIAAI